MRKKLSLFISVIILVFFVTLPAFALVDIGTSKVRNAATTAGFDKTTTDTTLSATIGFTINVLLTFVGTIFLALTVYAGLMWMTARENEEQATKAKGTIRTSIIGLVLCIGAYSLTTFILPRITSKTSDIKGAKIVDCCITFTKNTPTDAKVVSTQKAKNECGGEIKRIPESQCVPPPKR